MKQLLFAILLTFSGFVSFAQSENTAGIIYGKNHAFSVRAPEGWVLDNQAGITQGLHAVFYKKGESWRTAQTVMYVNTGMLIEGAHKTLDNLITYDQANFKKEYPDIIYTDADDITIAENVAAKVKHLESEIYGNHEAIAYIDAGKTAIMVVLSSRSEEGFKGALPAFEELVKSYFFISEDIMINDN